MPRINNPPFKLVTDGYRVVIGALTICPRSLYGAKEGVQPIAHWVTDQLLAQVCAKIKFQTIRSQ